MQKDTFLLEIGCEELPAGQINALVLQLQNLLLNELQKLQLEHGQSVVFASPRRIAIKIADLTTTQAPQRLERRGPSVDQAYSQEGVPTLACVGFARSCNVQVEQLLIQETPKGKWVYCVQATPGRATLDLLPDIVKSCVERLNLEKPMRWGAADCSFVRPVHWVCAMFGPEVVRCHLFNLEAGPFTYGHRFHCNTRLRLETAQHYEDVLASKGFVIADFEKRRALIQEQIASLEKQNRFKVEVDTALLDEVTQLVEWPVVMLSHFNVEFLRVPSEALITSMKEHQRCFPVLDLQGKLLNHFVLVSNIASKNPAQVVLGNQKVLNARLSDAAFFFENDRKESLQQRQATLKTVVFQAKLSTLQAKSKRILSLSAAMAPRLRADNAATKRAALLCKCDLTTNMVKEFPSLQGVMGYHYALLEGETALVATAIREHYYPRFAGDLLPKSPEGIALALADRLDTLVGIIGIREIPTGEKDPFGLRRAAIGVIRLLIENEAPLSLVALLEKATRGYQKQLENAEVVAQTLHFIGERLRAWYYEQGFSKECFAAVKAAGMDNLFDFQARMVALREFTQKTESHALAAANKRVSNLLKQTTLDIKGEVDPALFAEPAEKALHQALLKVQKKTKTALKQRHYQFVLETLSTLQKPVDHFFDTVMVLCPEQRLQKNRLRLLFLLHHLFYQIADIALLS